MRAALSLARRGLGNTAPNPTVGCILVKDGPQGPLVVGRGWTQPGGRPHAEAMALEQAGAAASGATAYVTLEPCAHQGVTPPCAEALVAASIKRCVVALEDPDERVAGKGLELLKQAGIDIEKNVLKKEAWRTNLGFFKRITEHRPEFTLKLATDRDGRIPPRGAEGEAKWITSPEARRRGHLLRAQHDAVIFGIGTVRNFRGMAATGNASQHLIMGPWAHTSYNRRLGELDFGPLGAAVAANVIADVNAFLAAGRS